MTLNPGDQVWVAKHSQFHDEYICQDCCGEGRVYNKNGVELSCPTCHGNKTCGHTQAEWRPALETVFSVLEYVHAEGRSVYIVYFKDEDDDCSHDDDYYLSEFETANYVGEDGLNTIFENEAECIAYCNEMNEKHPERNF